MIGSLYLYVIHPMGQDQIDQLIAGMVGLGGQPVQLGQDLLPDADGDHSVAVLAPSFDYQGVVFHLDHLPFHIKYRLT